MKTIDAIFAVASLVCACVAQTPPAKTGDPIYQQLRSVSTGGEVVIAENLVFKRDAGTFTFKNGTIAFLAPVNGKVTGAVFVGEGTLTLEPPLPQERQYLRLLTKEDRFDETFNEVVFRFTDNSYEELKKLGSKPPAPVSTPAGSLLADINLSLRKKLKYNIHARLLQDVLSNEPGGFFAAFIHGKKYSSKEAFVIDPHGVQVTFDLRPEEVAFLTYEEGTANAKYGVWAAFHYSSEYANGTASGSQQNSVVMLDWEKLDTTIERSGKLTGTAATTFVAVANGVRVVPLELFPTLRVKSVKDEKGNNLAFIQEDKEEDSDFAVILGEPVAAGEKYTVVTEYSGVDAVTNQGSGNYYPVARDDWYPNTFWGDFASYEMTFRIPRGLQLIATGLRISEHDEGEQNVSVWKSEAPQGAAGFNFGRFKAESASLKDQNYAVEAYANLDAPDFLAGIKEYFASIEAHEGVRVIGVGALGTFNTTGMMKKTVGEAQLSIPLYTDFFGPSTYHRLAMTQQTAPNYGQSWPQLIYMPVTSYLDETTRHQIGMDDPKGFFKVVGPHEIAHQWWGNTVGIRSYRDQWLSEGFAEFSASLFLQNVYPQPDYNKFMADERDVLFRKNRQGYRPIEVGPLNLGTRLINTKTGTWVYAHLIYPKGGYVLHMIRMMMWDMQSGDARFKETMRDFVATYRGKPATTEDFKAVVEKHMRPDMNIGGNGKMDWFFNEWVYGTTVPSYKFEHSFGKTGDGSVSLNIKLTQSGVDDSFVMPVPVYLEFTNGKIFRIGAIPMKGNTTFERSIALRGIQEPPKRAVINYFNDVLARND